MSYCTVSCLETLPTQPCLGDVFPVLMLSHAHALYVPPMFSFREQGHEMPGEGVSVTGYPCPSTTTRDSATQLPPEAEQRLIGRVHPHPEFELSAADQLGLRRLVVYDDALAATAAEQEPRPAAALCPQRQHFSSPLLGVQ